MEVESTKNIFTFPAPALAPDPVYEDYRDFQSVPIVIDNGSHEVKAGWATEEQPRLVFRPQIVKLRIPREDGKDLFVGNDVAYAELGKVPILSPFDGNIVHRYDAEEFILDHLFSHLGLNGDAVTHPILMTEPVCNPNYCRQQMSELFFECYQAPRVTYAIDSLLSHYYSASQGSRALDTALILSLGNTHTHVIPYIDGRIVGRHMKRISVGGESMHEYMTTVMSLKYPFHRAEFSPPHVDHLIKQHIYVAQNYTEELSGLLDVKTAESQRHIMQLPFEVSREKTAEEIARHAEEMRMRGVRMQERAAAIRRKKMIQREDELQDLLTVQNYKSEDKKEFTNLLNDRGIEDEEQLQERITTLQEQIRQAQAKLLGIVEEEEEPAEQESAYNLIDIPDAELDEDDLKEKKKQMLIKVMAEGRARVRKEKEERKAREEEQKKLEEEQRQRDPEGWLNGLRTERAAIVQRRADRERLKTQLADRRSAASMQRMKLIALQAQSQMDENFGERDEDWRVYRDIAKDDSDNEEEDNRLEQISALLQEHDPTEVKKRSGPTAEDYQVFVDVERIRIPETFLQPSLLGSRQCGLMETVQLVLNRFDADTQNRLVQNIFITGGPSLVPGMTERIQHEMRLIRPYGSPFNVYRANDARLDAWRGGALFARQPEAARFSIQRAQYDECGPGYLQEHAWSNVLLPPWSS